MLTFSNTGALGFNFQTGTRTLGAASSNAGTVVLNALIADATSTAGCATAVQGLGGLLQLANANNTYSGGTVVNAAGATVQATAAKALGIGVLNASNGTIDLNGFSQTVGRLTGAANGTITNSGATSVVLSEVVSSAQTFSGNITGNLALTLTGNATQQLQGTNNSYTGNTTISGAQPGRQ